MTFKVILCLLVDACSPTQPKPPIPPPEPSIVDAGSDGQADAQSDSEAGYTCATACQNQADLGCPLADPTPAGNTCQDACELKERVGILMWDTECLTNATMCGLCNVK